MGTPFVHWIGWLLCSALAKVQPQPIGKIYQAGFDCAQHRLRIDGFFRNKRERENEAKTSSFFQCNLTINLHRHITSINVAHPYSMSELLTFFDSQVTTLFGRRFSNGSPYISLMSSFF